MPNAVVKPLNLRWHDTELATNVQRTVAYRAVCACGWRGPARDRHHEARADAREHNQAERGKTT